MNKRLMIHSVAALALLTSAACAQNPPPPPAGPAPAPAAPTAVAPAPPPPPPPGAPAPPAPAAAAPVAYTGPSVNESGSVRNIVYGPQGEVQTLILRNDKIVMLPPDLGVQLGATLAPGTSVAITGFLQTFGRQQQLTAQSVRINGQTFNAGAAPVPPPPAAPTAAPAQPVPPAPPSR